MDSERARLASPGVAWEAAFQAMAASFATDTAAVGERERLAEDEPVVCGYWYWVMLSGATAPLTYPSRGVDGRRTTALAKGGTESLRRR